MSVFGVAAFLCMASGVRELHRYQYYTPRLAEKVANYGDWEDLRFRHPSPGALGEHDFEKNNVSRSLHKLHYKTPFERTYHNVRGKHNWNYEKEHGGRNLMINNTPDLEKLTPEQEKNVYQYIEGEDEYNAYQKNAYKNLSDILHAHEDTKGFQEKLQGWSEDPASFIEQLSDSITEQTYQCGWDVEGHDNPGEIKYDVPKPDNSYIMEYNLSYVSSQELQLFLELEHWLIDYTRHLELSGQKTLTGSTESWYQTDFHLPADEVDKVAKVLKSKRYAEQLNP